MEQPREFLQGIAYADALGLPFEAQTAHQLANVVVDHLSETHTHPEFPQHKAGTISDDTQQSMALSYSLVRKGYFDIEDIAACMAEEYVRSPNGWGKGSAATVEAIINGAPLHEACENRETEGGCGALMRMAPLVWWQDMEGVNTDESIRQYKQLCNLTHNHPVARRRAVEHGLILRGLIDEDIKPDSFADDTERLLDEHGLGSQTSLVAQLKLLDRLKDDPKAYRLSLFSMLTNPEKPFTGGDVQIMTYASYMHESRYYEGLDEVIHLGGDTDSTAVIFAAMSFAAHGRPEQWPPTDYDKVQRIDEIEDITEAFFSS